MWGRRIAVVGASALVVGALAGCTGGLDAAACAEFEVVIDEFADAAGAAATDATELEALRSHLPRLDALGAQEVSAASETFIGILQSAAAGGGDDVDDAAMTWGVAVADQLRACGMSDG